MSIKIYSGALLERDLSLLDVRAMALKIRPVFDAHVEEKQTQMISRIAVRAHDNALSGTFEMTEDVTDYSCPAGEGFNRLSELRDEHKKDIAGWLPMDFEAVLIPIGRGKTLILPYGDRDLSQKFLEMTGARPYGYWDNTDPDEDVSAKEWRQREKDWKKAFGPKMAMTPSEAGTTIQLVSNKYSSWWVPEISDLESSISSSLEHSIPSRAARIALDLARQEHFRNRLPEPSNSLMARSIREFEKAAKESPLLEQISTMAAAVECMLGPLTEADLRKPVKELIAAGTDMFRAIAETRGLSDATSEASFSRKPTSL